MKCVFNVKKTLKHIFELEHCLYVSVEVSLARPSCELIKGANLYVSGLPKSMTQRELESMFVPCGNIITSRILCDSQTGCVLVFIDYSRSVVQTEHSVWCVCVRVCGQ